MFQRDLWTLFISSQTHSAFSRRKPSNLLPTAIREQISASVNQWLTEGQTPAAPWHSMHKTSTFTQKTHLWNTGTTVSIQNESYIKRPATGQNILINALTERKHSSAENGISVMIYSLIYTLSVSWNIFHAFSSSSSVQSEEIMADLFMYSIKAAQQTNLIILVSSDISRIININTH